MINDELSRRGALKLFGIAALGVSGLSACAPTSSDDGGGTSDAEAAAKEFGFLSWSLSEESAKPWITETVGSYSSSNSVEIKTGAYPYDEYLNQLTLQVRGGEFAGVAQLDVGWLGTLAAMGRLVDLGDAAGTHDYTPAALSAGQVDGAQLGLPWVTGSTGLIGNKEILDAAGVVEPTTIEEFEAALAAIKAHDESLIPWAAMTHVDQLKDSLMWMKAFGSPLVDGDEITLGDAASADALTWLKKLYDEKLIAPDVDRFAARTLFGQAKTAIYEDAIVARGAVASASPDPDIASKMVPMARPVLKSGDDPVGVLWGHLLVVADGPGRDAAIDFATWLSGDTDTAVDYFSELGLPPTTTSALGSPTVAEDTFTTIWTEKITANADVSPFWKYPNVAQMESAVATQVQAVLIGEASAQDALNTARDELAELAG